MGLTKSKRVYYNNEIEQLFNGLDNLRDKALFSFYYLYGCRRQEALDLKRKDIWVEEGLLCCRIHVKKRKDYQHLVKVNVNNRYAQFIIAHMSRIPMENKLWNISGRTVLRILTRILPDGYVHRFRDHRLTKLAEQGATEMQLVMWAGWVDGRPAKTYIHRSGKLIEDLGKRIT